jgi:hypothetical protein
LPGRGSGERDQLLVVIGEGAIWKNQVILEAHPDMTTQERRRHHTSQFVLTERAGHPVLEAQSASNEW